MKTKYDALEEKAKKATPGPWTWKQVGTFSFPGCALFWLDTSKGGVHCRRLDYNGAMVEADAGYITAACAAVPDLIADVRALAEALERLQSWAWAMTMSATPLHTVSGDHPLAQSMSALKRIQEEGK